MIYLMLLNYYFKWDLVWFCGFKFKLYTKVYSLQFSNLIVLMPKAGVRKEIKESNLPQTYR